MSTLQPVPAEEVRQAARRADVLVLKGHASRSAFIDGLVVESTAPSVGRGRPRLRYTVDASADSRWGVAGPYERLSLMLTEIIRTGESAVEVGRRAGRRG